MRNLELELVARPAVRAAVAPAPGLRIGPSVQVALSLATLATVIGAALVLGYQGAAMLAAVLVALAWLVKGRDGLAIIALLALGSLPYLVLVLRLGAGA